MSYLAFARRLISRSTASRMKARRSSSAPLAASIRASVPASKDISHFSGNLRMRPKIISVSRIRYVDSEGTISHIRFQNNRRRSMQAKPQRYIVKMVGNGRMTAVFVRALSASDACARAMANAAPYFVRAQAKLVAA